MENIYPIDINYDGKLDLIMLFQTYEDGNVIINFWIFTCTHYTIDLFFYLIYRKQENSCSHK